MTSHDAGQLKDDAPLRRALRPAGPINLSLSESRGEGQTVIAIGGELDLLTAPRVAAVLDDVVRRRRDDHVIIDLRQASFIDSAGLHVLLNAKRRLVRRSRRMHVISDAGPVRRVLELSRLIETLGVVASPELGTPSTQRRAPH